VSIPKPDGGERPLGIPTIRDRVVQTAAKLVLEPIFEADFEDSAYGYRPARRAVSAARSPMTTQVAIVFPVVASGMIDASVNAQIVDAVNLEPAAARALADPRWSRRPGESCASKLAYYFSSTQGASCGQKSSKPF
jgi:retron-type reverse transcriptase